MNDNASTLNSAIRFHNVEMPDFLARRVEEYYRGGLHNTWNGEVILWGLIPGPDALQLTSNDYLSIASHPKMLDAMKKALHKSGNGLLMSAVFSHGDNPLRRLEDTLAHFMHAESGLICQSGWCANIGLMQGIADEKTPVYIDILAHASFWEGVHSAGAKAIPILHNDYEHLERQILRHGPGVVLVDSVYSVRGTICPLPEVADICSARGCVLVVDESHSLGTHGPNGEGLVVALGLADRVHFRTASLAKAFAGRAGFITCSRRANQYIKSQSGPAIFSSSLLPHDIAGLQAALDIICEERWRRERLHANAAYLRAELDALGYNLNGSGSQIISLESGTNQQTVILRDALESRGVFGSVFCAPAAPKDRAMIRFSINAALTNNDLQRLVDTCREIRNEVDMANWPSTRRKQRIAKHSATAFPWSHQNPVPHATGDSLHA